MAFSIPLAALAEKMKADLDDVVRKSTYTVFEKVIKKTPVDTGRAKGNWQVSYSVPLVAETAREDKTPVESIGNNMTEELLKLNNIPVGGVTYMSNSLPYIRVLEHGGYPNPPKSGTGKTSGGYSIQAAQGMVRLSAIEFSDYVKQAIASK